MAAPVVESQSALTYGNRSNSSFTAPTGITDGDLLVVLMSIGANDPVPTLTLPTGFAYVPGTWPLEASWSGYSIQLAPCYKIASGESGNYATTHTAADTSGVMVRISGADQANPFVPTPSQNFHDGGTIAQDTVFNAITTLVNDCLILACQIDWGDTTFNLSPPSGTTPTFTELHDATITYLASGVLAVAGDTGQKTMANNANESNPWASTLIAVQPASATPPITDGPPLHTVRAPLQWR